MDGGWGGGGREGEAGRDEEGGGGRHQIYTAYGTQAKSDLKWVGWGGRDGVGRVGVGHQIYTADVTHAKNASPVTERGVGGVEVGCGRVGVGGRGGSR